MPELIDDTLSGFPTYIQSSIWWVRHCREIFSVRSRSLNCELPVCVADFKKFLATSEDGPMRVSS